jgi:hypothetical protein
MAEIDNATTVSPARRDYINRLRRLMIEAEEPETRAAFAELLRLYVTFQVRGDAIFPQGVVK